MRNSIKSFLAAAPLALVMTSGNAVADDQGVWVLTGVNPQKSEGSASPCYPGRRMNLSDGVAEFHQGYADCTGEQKIHPGDHANTTITWSFSHKNVLPPGEPLVATVDIVRNSSPVPYSGGGLAVFYFRSQSAVGTVGLRGSLDNPQLLPSTHGTITLDRIPGGRHGDKLDLWMNVTGESGIGDVFYSYEFKESAGAGAAAEPPTDDRVTCSQYARLAIAENEENIARGCGYSGIAWHSNYDAHFKWCMDGNRLEAEKLHDRRMVDLSHCNPKPQNTGQPQMMPVPGQAIAGTTYQKGTVGDPFKGGSWTNAQNNSDWLQRNFDGLYEVSEISIERAGTDVTTSGSRMVLSLQGADGNWVIIDQLRDTNINMDKLSFGGIGQSIPSYTKVLDRPVVARAFRLEFTGNGWFSAKNIEILGVPVN